VALPLEVVMNTDRDEAITMTLVEFRP